MPGESRLTHATVDLILALIEETAGHDVDLSMDGLTLRLEGSAPPPAARPAAADPVPVTLVPPAPSTAVPSSAGSRAVLAPRAGGVGLPAGLAPGHAVTVETVVATIGADEPVRAGVAGVVGDVFVSDGDLVHYGQVLLRLSPAA